MAKGEKCKTIQFVIEFRLQNWIKFNFFKIKLNKMKEKSTLKKMLMCSLNTIAHETGTISEIDWEDPCLCVSCVVLLLKFIYSWLVNTHTYIIMCESHFPLSLLLLLYNVQILILLTVCETSSNVSKHIYRTLGLILTSNCRKCMKM